MQMVVEKPDKRRRQVYEYIASTKKFCKCLFLLQIEVLNSKFQAYTRNGFKSYGISRRFSSAIFSERAKFGNKIILRLRSFGVIQIRISDPRSVWIMVHQRNRRNPLWSWIHRFLWCTMIQTDLESLIRIRITPKERSLNYSRRANNLTRQPTSTTTRFPGSDVTGQRYRPLLSDAYLPRLARGGGECMA